MKAGLIEIVDFSNPECFTFWMLYSFAYVYTHMWTRSVVNFVLKKKVQLCWIMPLFFSGTWCICLCKEIGIDDVLLTKYLTFHLTVVELCNAWGNGFKWTLDINVNGAVLKE